MSDVALQKAVNVIKMPTWTSPVDFRYQDETSRFKVECDRIAALKRNEIYVPKPWESLPYLAKEDRGKIHVRGFLHPRIAQNSDGSFCHPGTLSTEETMDRLHAAWNQHAKACRENKVTHHRLVFSLSREFHEVLVQAGRNPDTVLRGVIDRSMRAVQEKFHPGDSVGYTFGLHHDTDNLHAHVFVHPRTKNGEFVGMSGKPKRHQGHASAHKDQLGFLREAVRRRVAGVVKELAEPREADYLARNIRSEKVHFIPRQSHTMYPTKDHRPRTADDYRLEQKRAAVAAFDEKITGTKQVLREASQGRHFTACFLPRQPKWLRLLKKAHTASLFRQVRELQAERYRLVSDYWLIRRLVAQQARVVTRPRPDAPEQKQAIIQAPKAEVVQVPKVRVRPPQRSISTKPAPHQGRGF